MQASIINERANVSDRPSEASKFLQELQQLKPSRAVDRTFNENSVVRAF